MVLVLLARKPTDSVTYGLLPAAEKLGLHVRLLTDHPVEHLEVCRRVGARPAIMPCEVTDVRAVLAVLSGHPGLQGVLSNSDHLQTQTALVADYLGLPGKDWRSALRARDKGLMREWLHQHEFYDGPAAYRIRSRSPMRLLDFEYPCVLKPAAGVASEDVYLIEDGEELVRRVDEIRSRRDDDLVLERLIEGPLHTLETIGDGHGLRIWGGWATRISAGPRFVEERLTWQPTLDPGVVTAVLAQLTSLGVGFGPCHTEFIVSEDGPQIVEVNDRLIGDHCDFAMADVLSEPIFEDVIRLHLGRPLPQAPARAVSRQGVVHSVIAARDGVLTSAPGRLSLGAGSDAGDDGSEPLTLGDGVRLEYRPVRQPGVEIRVTGTNRDYLGTVQVTGPDLAGVEAAIEEFLGSRSWVIE